MELSATLKQVKNQLEQRVLTLRGKKEKFKEDLHFLRDMKDGLSQNREPLRKKIQEAWDERAAAKEMLSKTLPPLEGKLAMLYAQLEGG